jgi:RNA polymerase sigma factor (sigma-70 family)
MDNLLIPYLNARDESERQQRLDELIQLQAGPAVMHTVRQKLGFRIDPNGRNPTHPDVADLYQEIMIRIIQKLSDLSDSPVGNEIEHFRTYASGVAANACMDHLRSKRPARKHLKDKIRIALIKHPDLAIWRARREYECGFAIWLDLDTPSVSPQKQFSIAEDLSHFRSSRFPHVDVTRVPLTRVLAELFEWVSAPIELGRLVDIVAALMKIEVDENPVTSIDHDQTGLLEPRSREVAIPNSSQVDVVDLLRRIWQSANQLPAEQRDAFCFYVHDDEGNDFFGLLLETGIVTLPELARKFDRSGQEIRRLRSQMPMDAATVAAELNTSVSLANKWRFRAIKRLKNELSPKRRK